MYRQWFTGIATFAALAFAGVQAADGGAVTYQVNGQDYDKGTTLLDSETMATIQADGEARFNVALNQINDGLTH